MTKPTVTDVMVEAAEQAYLKNSERAVEVTPLEAAITAAINASGLVERTLPHVASLPAIGDTFEEMRANIDTSSPAYARGDMVLRWVNSGAILFHEILSTKDTTND